VADAGAGGDRTVLGLKAIIRAAQRSLLPRPKLAASLSAEAAENRDAVTTFDVEPPRLKEG